MPNRIKIVIADDHLLFVEGLKLILEQCGNIDIVDVANDGRELLEIISKYPADLVLLDLNMPKMAGFESIRFIKLHNKLIKIIILSTYTEVHLVNKAKDLGVQGYIIKNSNRDQLVECIYEVIKGGLCFPVQVSNQLKDSPGTESFDKSLQLSNREREIIQLIKQGQTNKEMSQTLTLSIYTVETHRKNIMHKLQLKNPAALMKFIIENNL